MKWLSAILVSSILVSLSALGGETPDVVAIMVQKAPKIDGKLSDEAWLDVAKNHRGVMSGWRRFGGDGGLVPQQRIAYVCYDAQALYIGMQAFTPDIYKLKSDANGNPFLGDCLEVHFKIPEGEYYQFGTDILGQLAIGKAPKGVTLDGIVAASDFGDNCWIAEISIPWSTLKLVPKPGLRLGFTLAANNAYQGNGVWSAVYWGNAYSAQSGNTVLELR
jgi:hypothetical protein